MALEFCSPTMLSENPLNSSFKPEILKDTTENQEQMSFRSESLDPTRSKILTLKKNNNLLKVTDRVLNKKVNHDLQLNKNLKRKRKKKTNPNKKRKKRMNLNKKKEKQRK